MTTPFERLAKLDRLVREPARLAILSALSACESADFLFLQRITGLSKGNLSSHVSRLEEAGLIVISKEFIGKTPRTTVGLPRLAAIGSPRIGRTSNNLPEPHADGVQPRPRPCGDPPNQQTSRGRKELGVARVKVRASWAGRTRKTGRVGEAGDRRDGRRRR